MDQLVNAFNSLVTWLQTPVVPCYIIALVIGGYEVLFAGGERGPAIGKKILLIATVAFIFIKGAGSLGSSLNGKINF